MSQLWTSPPTASGPDRAEWAQRINAATGSAGGGADADDRREKRIRARSAARHGEHCGLCGRTFEPDEPVWRQRVIVGYFISYCWATPPVCESCKPKWSGWLTPEACDGCGRPVHYEWSLRHRRRALCCNACGKRAQNRAERAARAEARGTRRCPTCAETFEPARADAKFCSSPCRQKAYRRRVTADKADNVVRPDKCNGVTATKVIAGATLDSRNGAENRLRQASPTSTSAAGSV